MKLREVVRGVVKCRSVQRASQERLDGREVRDVPGSCFSGLGKCFRFAGARLWEGGVADAGGM